MSVNQLRIFALNAADGFGDAHRVPGLLQEIDAYSPDVATFSEANATATGLHDGVREDLERRGYEITHISYGDDDGRKDKHDMLAIAKHEVVSSPSRTICLAGRSALLLTLQTDAGEIDYAGVHLFDRYDRNTDAGGRRVMQAEDLVGILSPDRPAIVAGDFNDVDPNWRAPFMKAVGSVARLFPDAEPGEPDYTGIRKVGSLGRKIGSMAAGNAPGVFMANGFENADPRKRPTRPSAHPIANIDHILTRGLDVSDFRVHDHLVHDGVALSDHRGISARLQIRDRK